MISLIIFILCAVLVATFAGFNIGNKCNVNIIVHTFENVSVFITIIVSFIVGFVVSLPFSFGKGRSIAAKKIAKIKTRAEKDAFKKVNEAEKEAHKKEMEIAKQNQENLLEKK
ncbi:MAG: hypothetical protein IKI31_03545 [Treponema sp.]|nr:hypothetical protein [Treponema sp.]